MKNFIRVYMRQVYTFWACNCYRTRIEWKINSYIRRKKNCDMNFVLRYDINSLCIAIYRHIVTPLHCVHLTVVSPGKFYPCSHTWNQPQTHRDTSYAETYTPLVPRRTHGSCPSQTVWSPQLHPIQAPLHHSKQEQCQGPDTPLISPKHNWREIEI